MKYHPGHLIPEGRFKELIKRIYHKYISPYSFTETKLTGAGDIYEYNFQNGVSMKFCGERIDNKGKRGGSEYWAMPGLLNGYLKKYRPSNGDIIFDLGAYVGTFCIYASKLVGKKGKVYAFEPHQEHFLKLKKNIALNNVTNVIAINKGLWDKKDTVKMYNDLDDSQASTLFDNKRKNTISVKVDSLDNFAKKNKINKIDFIKMDVEGAELEIIDGGKNSLINLSPKLAIASYHKRNGEETWKEVERKLKRLGYKVSTSYPNHLTTYGFQ